MRSLARLLILTGLVFAGCGAARDVAVTSFHVLDAPANFVRRRLDPPRTTTTTTVETTRTSDVSTPGREVITAPSPMATTRLAPKPKTATASRTAPPISKPIPSATPRPKSTAAQFPTAKPVPGKPGYVYSIDPKGGIVDVTGYKTGDKAKDPYTQQVFIVP